MDVSKSVSVSLPADQFEAVQIAVETGEFADVSHFVGDALLWFEASNAAPEDRREWLRRSFDDGVRSGPAIECSADDFFEGIKRRGRERMAAAKQAA